MRGMEVRGREAGGMEVRGTAEALLSGEEN